MLSSLTIGPLSRALKYLLWLLGVALILLISSIASFNYIQERESAIQLEEFKKIENDTLSSEAFKRAITVASLMASPDKYHNKLVWVKGYLNLEFEGDALYWRQRDYHANQYKNSFYVQFTDSLYQTKPVAAYSQHYVMVRGTFDANQNLRPGFIRNIDSINAVPITAR